MAIVHDKQLLDFADPGPLDEAILDLPGFVNEVTDWTLQSAHSPNRTLAFAGAGITVPMSAEAQAKYQSLMADFVAERRKLETGELKYARAILVRMPEKISKLALLSAISRDVAKPIIELGDLEWATKFVSHVSASMLHEAQFHVSEGKFDRLVKKALSFMKRAGGSIDRTSLLRAMHIDSQNFQRVVLTLHMCDMIEEEWLDRRKVVYTLKND